MSLGNLSCDATVLVVGDLILDRHVWGTVERVSPEAPIPVLNVEHTEESPGGAANVACKIVELGGHAILAGVVGVDAEGQRLLGMVSTLGVECEVCVKDASRMTTLKTRYAARGQQLLRADREDRRPISDEVTQTLVKSITRVLSMCDAVVIEDYGKGALTPEVLKIALSRSGEIPVIVDPNGADWSRYQGATVITPTAGEMEAAAGRVAGGRGDLISLAWELLDEASAGAIAVTRGARGIMVVTREMVEDVSTTPVEVYDVTGAGDAVAAVFALGHVVGLSLGETAALANVAGGLIVQQSGVGCLSKEKLSGVATLEEARQTAQRLKAEGRKVVFTNGCFDLLHHGHVKLLEEARRHGDFLIVGINSDASISRLKGLGRPILHQEQRSRVLGALSCVNLVVVFGDGADGDRPVRLIEAIRPDCLVKGGEFTEAQIVGAECVRGYGGDVVRVPLVEGVSTSSLVDQLKKRDGDES